jgi:hypothetical protein
MMQLLRRWASQKYAWKIWAIPFILISPAILIIPPDVFAQYPWARGFADFMAYIVPMIDRTSHLYPRPDQYRVFYAYAWAWLPLCIFLAHIEIKGRETFTPQNFDPLSIKFLLIMLCLTGAGVLFFYAPGDGGLTNSLMTRHDPRARFFSNSFTIAWSAPIIIYGAASIVIGWKKYLRLFFRALTVPSESKKSNPAESHK